MRQNTILWFFLIIVAISFSCKDSETQLPLQGKTYYHSFVSTREECTELLTNFGVNCAQTIEFLDESTATVTVTDILTSARYSTLDNLIVVTITQHPEFFEAENPMIFLANEDFTQLTRVSAGNQVWESSLPWSE